MESNPLYQGTLNILEKVLDFRARRHDAVVSNIANIDTPGYKAFDVVMDDALRRAGAADPSADPEMRRTHSGHFQGTEGADGPGTGRVVRRSAVIGKGDRNTVDLDRSMADLAENNLMYNALTQMVAKKFGGLRNVIQGGTN